MMDRSEPTPTAEVAKVSHADPTPSTPTKAPPSPTTPAPAKPAAVVVTGARKSYVPNNWILDNLDLVVPEASIYALLGASGCGKTTLLTCMLGLRHLNAGEVSVLGWRPGEPGSGMPGPRVGFMPQELALSEGFTIGETLFYFGRVCGLSNAAIEKRSNELLNFLQIPSDQARLVGQLSGGQKQRLSLAVTLLHSPPLLILDEPTVGVDPILRQNIWDFLVDLTRTSNTTVIITTHYIEEARQANMVGLMRRGKLLDEDGPDELMARYKCSSLEDVFLSLSVRQETVEVGTQDEVKKNQEKAVQRRASTIPTAKAPAYTPHSNVYACMWRACVFLRRYKWVTAFMVMMPIICMFAFVYSIGREPDGTHLAVVNEDYDCGPVWPGYPADCENTTKISGLSCRFVELLKESYNIIPVRSSDETAARRAVHAGQAWGYIQFSSNFSRHMTQRQVLYQDAPDEDVNNSEVTAHLDMSNQLISNMLKMALYRTAINFHKDMQDGCGFNPKFTAVPIDESDPIYGSKDPSFQDYALPGVLIISIYFPAIYFATASFLDDKLNGVMNRSAAAGVTHFEMLVARAVLDSAINTVSVICVVIFTFVIFQFHSEGSYLILTVLLYLEGLAGLWLGYFVAVCCDAHYPATFLGLGIFLGSSFMSGMFWPVQGMHWLIKWSAPFTPLMPAVEAARTVLFQGSNPTTIGMGFLIVGIWIGILAAATVVVIRFRSKTS